MKYGEIPSAEEVNKVLAENAERQEIFDIIKQELTGMEVGSWLVYRGGKDAFAAPPISILAVDIKGEFDFYTKDKNCYIKRIK